MRVIPLSQFEIKVPGREPDTIVDKVALEGWAHHVDPDKGMKIAEMGKALDLGDKIKAANGRLVLEDSDWELLCGKIKQIPFALVDRGFYDLAQRVLKSPFVSPDAYAKMKAENQEASNDRAGVDQQAASEQPSS